MTVVTEILHVQLGVTISMELNGLVVTSWSHNKYMCNGPVVTSHTDVNTAVNKIHECTCGQEAIATLYSDRHILAL